MNKSSHIAGLLFATIFGFSFMFSKVALAYVSPIGLIAYRFLVAFIIFELLRLTKVVTIKFHKYQVKALLFVVLFQPILYFLFETYGLNFTTSAEAGMMIALIPIFVTILSGLILHERIKGIQIFFILLSVTGVIFIQLAKTNGGLQFQILGFVLLLLAVISAAMFNIASKSASKHLKPYELTYFMMLSGAIVFNMIYITQLLILRTPAVYYQVLTNVEVLLPIIYLGSIASIGGFFLVNYALSKLPAHVTSIYANLSTIVAIIAGAIFLNETLYIYHIIGSAMIITGVYGVVRTNRKQNKKFIKV
ncbi:MAG: DMT family transporter [Acholeplasmataceae bacterium]